MLKFTNKKNHKDKLIDLYEAHTKNKIKCNIIKIKYSRIIKKQRYFNKKFKINYKSQNSLKYQCRP